MHTALSGHEVLRELSAVNRENSIKYVNNTNIARKWFCSYSSIKTDGDTSILGMCSSKENFIGIL